MVCLLKLKYAPLHINGESYFFLPNDIHYTLKWISIIDGERLANNLIDFNREMNKFGLTQKEVSLLIPFVLTITTG